MGNAEYMGQILSSSPNLGGRTTADSILRRSREREDKEDKDGRQAGTDVRGFLGADRQCKEPRSLRDQGRGDLLEGEPAAAAAAGERQRDADLGRGGTAQCGEGCREDERPRRLDSDSLVILLIKCFQNLLCPVLTLTLLRMHMLLFTLCPFMVHDKYCQLII